MTHVTISLEDYNSIQDRLEDYEERLTIIEEKMFPQEEDETDDVPQGEGSGKSHVLDEDDDIA